MQWSEARIEACDLPYLYLIGSADLRGTFGSYRVSEISWDPTGQDEYHHHDRVRGIIDSLRRGDDHEPPILVGEFGREPLVIIDGNHRCLAHHVRGTTAGLPVYFGTADNLLMEFVWASRALSVESH